MDAKMQLGSVQFNEHSDSVIEEKGESHVNENNPVVVAISGCKNSGKTTFLEQLLPVLSKRGIRTAVLKHDGHTFEPDVPGTDSYRIRKAGAEGTAIYCDSHYMIIKNKKITADDLVKEFSDMDLILGEGFKSSDYPKIELIRQANSQNMVCDPKNVLAVATDCGKDFPVKKIGLEDYEEAADLIEQYMREAKTK